MHANKTLTNIMELSIDVNGKRYPYMYNYLERKTVYCNFNSASTTNCKINITCILLPNFKEVRYT